jgi:glycosyltransferase involved in cell wall biosynthesis
MHCPTLKDLPPPPPGKTGWPWTEESKRLSNQMSDGRPWPRISVVTPSYNQGQFIEETIRSILLQGYPDLEYLVLDGASTDNSVEIIKKYSSWLSYWISEPDSGQSDAINRGLKMALGDFATWINSDDMLCKNALADHASHIGFDTNVVYVGFCAYMDQDSNPVFSHRGRVCSLEDLVRIETVWRSKEHRGNIDQPAVLFPRALALSAGGLNTDNHYTMDYELWGRFFLAGAKFQYTDIPFGMFRVHPNQKTHNMLRITESLLDTATKLVRLGDCFSEKTKREILADLEAYKNRYEKNYWKGSGRLAKIGLPPLIVIPLRRLRAVLQSTFKAAEDPK